MQQLDILESVGVKPEHVTIGHTCCLDDPEVTIISEIAKRGAFVGFDRVTTVQQIMPDDKKVAMVVKFLEAGHADKLLLSADFTGQRTMEAGPGYGRTVTVFAPLLARPVSANRCCARFSTTTPDDFWRLFLRGPERRGSALAPNLALVAPCDCPGELRLRTLTRQLEWEGCKWSDVLVSSPRLR